MRINTRDGDGGETALAGGQRVRKDDLRVDACGIIDELSSSLGLAAALGASPQLGVLIEGLQCELFSVAADLATPDCSAERAMTKPEMVGLLEVRIDDVQSRLPPLANFVIPGGTQPSAALHVARTVCRRAERAVARMGSEHAVGDVIPAYLNRLSDLLFAMARAANREAGVDDVTWSSCGPRE